MAMNTDTTRPATGQPAAFRCTCGQTFASNEALQTHKANCQDAGRGQPRVRDPQQPQQQQGAKRQTDQRNPQQEEQEPADA